MAPARPITRRGVGGVDTEANRGAETAVWLCRLTVSQGVGAGERLRLFPWENRFIGGTFRAGVLVSCLSVGRGNGKSTLCAGLAAAAVAGPLAQPRGEVILVASSHSQARITFGHVAEFLRGRFDLSDRSRWRVADSHNLSRIENRANGAAVRVLGSDPKRAHGLAPSLILADEPAQWPRGTAEAMYAALRTALGKVSGCRFLCLGTRPADPEHWFSRLLDGGSAASRYVQCHSADREADPGDREAWKAANPSLPYMPTLERVLEAEAAEAASDPATLQAFRALRLNCGVADVIGNPLITPEAWAACEAEADKLPPRSGPCFFGVDLAGGAALSAVAAYWPRTGRAEAFAAVPAVPDLLERGRLDAVGTLYADMAARGELLVLGNRVVDVSELLGRALRLWGRPRVVCADRFRQRELMQALEAAGFPVTRLEPRGQGFRDQSEDIRAFTRAVLSGRVRAPRSLLLRSAFAEATTISDPAGNRKLSRRCEGGRRARGRDDPAAALLLAIGAGTRAASQTPRPRLRVAVAG